MISRRDMIELFSFDYLITYNTELSTGQAVMVSCPVLPPVRTKVGSRTGQDRTKNLVLLVYGQMGMNPQITLKFRAH